MAGFSFDFSALTQISRDIQKIGNTVKKNERVAVKLAGNAYKNDVQPLLQYKTGTLRRSVHVETSEEGGHPIALVGTNAIYAKQREYGGVIKAKNVPYLKFKTEDGKWVQTKQVYQPPHPVWRPTWDTNLRKYIRIMFAALSGERVDIEAEFGDYVQEQLTIRSVTAGMDWLNWTSWGRELTGGDVEEPVTVVQGSTRAGERIP